MTSLGRASSNGISRLVSMSIKTGLDRGRMGRPPAGRPRPLPRMTSLTSSPRRLGVGGIGFWLGSLAQLTPLLPSGVIECLSGDLDSKCGFTTACLLGVDGSGLLLE
jgi:hypothetical protein